MADRNINQEVYRSLQKIPKGKATTYGSIAKRLDLNPRQVGRILSKNERPAEYPCYKVVRSDGSLGGYTIRDKNDAATLDIKKKKLLADGVFFDKGKVDKASLMSM